MVLTGSLVKTLDRITGFQRKLSMKCINFQLSMSKVVGRLPRSLLNVVTDPIHEVLQLSVPKFGVWYRLNLEFRDVVHIDGERGGHDSAREGVWNMGL